MCAELSQWVRALTVPLAVVGVALWIFIAAVCVYGYRLGKGKE